MGNSKKGEFQKTGQDALFGGFKMIWRMPKEREVERVVILY